MDFVHNPYRCGPLRVGRYVLCRSGERMSGHRVGVREI